MYTKQSKKLSLFNTLEILKNYTDKDHRLSQTQIVDILRKEYDMEVDRRTVKRNLMDLKFELKYDIKFHEIKRMAPNSRTGEIEDNSIQSGFFLEHEFKNSELRLLIDSLLFSKHVPYSQCKELVGKLEKLSNKYFKSRMSYIATMPEDKTNNQQVFHNIDRLDEAIRSRKKVSFKYLEYGTDKKQHPKCRPDGTDRVYIVSPYQMAAKEGKYYLICNYDKYNDISNYRIDRITDIQILEEQAKPFEELIWSDGRKLNLSDYMKQHIYMYSSDKVKARFQIKKVMISDIIDTFGHDVRFYDENVDTVCVITDVNKQAMIQFAKNFAPDVVVLEPKSLREQVKEELKKGLAAYE